MSANYFGATAIANISIQETSGIQKALDACYSPQMFNFGYPSLQPSQSLPGGTVRLPRGVFKGDLYIGNRGTTLEGEGEGTIIDGSVYVNAGRCRVRNLTIVRPITAPYCLKMSWTSAANKLDRTVIDNVITYGGDIGMLIDAAILVTVKHSYFLFANTYAGRVQRTVPPYGSPSIQPTNTTLKFFDCGFQNSHGMGLSMAQSSNTLIQACNFTDCAGHCIDLNGLEGATIMGCNLESYIDLDVMCFVVNNTGPVLILNNWFNSGYGVNVGAGLTDIWGNPAFDTHSPTRAINVQGNGIGYIACNRFLLQKGAGGNGTGFVNDISSAGCTYNSRNNQYSAGLTYRNLGTNTPDTPPAGETN